MNKVENESYESFESMLRAALEECAKEEIARIEQMDTSDVVCPKRVDRAVRRMIAAGAPKAQKHKASPKRVVTRLLVAALLLASLLVATFLSVSAIREAIYKTVVTWCDDYVSVSFEWKDDAENNSVETPITPDNSDTNAGETPPETTVPSVPAPTEILQYKKPSDLPANYEAEEVLKGKTQYIVDYYDENEWCFSYIQMVLDDIDVWFDDTQKELAKDITIDGIKAVIVLSQTSGENMIAWTDESYIYHISGYLSETELIEMVKNVK